MSIKKEFEKKKEYILKCAQNVFGLFGPKKTTIDNISKHANIGKGTLYNYFKNKEHLFFAVVEKEENELKENIRNKLEKNENKTVKEKLDIYIKTKIKYLMSLKNYYNAKINHYDQIYPEIKDIFDSFNEFEKEIFLNIFKKGIEKGEIKIDEPSAFADALILTLNSVEFYLLIKKEYNSIKEIFNKINTIICLCYSNIKV